MAEIDLDLGLRLNAHLNLTFYFLIHPTLIKTHLVFYFQSHFFLSNFILTLFKVTLTLVTLSLKVTLKLDLTL